MSKKSFLCCHPGALGDFILTWPALAVMRHIFPEHEFIAIGHYPYLELAKRLKLIDVLHDLETRYLHNFFSGKNLPPELGEPDGAVLWFSDSSEIIKILEPITTQPVLSLNPKPQISYHISQYYLRQIQHHYHFAISPKMISLNQFSLSRQNPDLILIHPGSGSLQKNYSPRFYKCLANFFWRQGFPKVKIILGPAEISCGLHKEFQASHTIITENLNEFHKILSKVLLFIGNDSGVSHLAAILGIPTIAIYKNTDPLVWGVMGNEVQHISVTSEEQALATIKILLANKKYSISH
jgi:ADP-heptose:LPS heptosyltransferase